MALFCSCNYKNNDFTCSCHKQCDDLGCKVQYSTNNKFYPSLQIEWSQGLTILRYGVKSWQAHQRFYIYCFMTNHGIENSSWKSLSVYFHQQTWDHVTMMHPVWSSHQGNGQTLGTSKVHSVLKVPLGKKHPSSSIFIVTGFRRLS